MGGGVLAFSLLLISTTPYSSYYVFPTTETHRLRADAELRLFDELRVVGVQRVRLVDHNGGLLLAAPVSSDRQQATSGN